MDSIITKLYTDLRKRPEVRDLIPMGYVPGYPVLSVKNNKLVAIVPFLRYRVTGEVDRTIVFPVRFAIEYQLPSLRVVGFADLSMARGFDKVDFNKGVGFFRHQAIKDLDREAYAQLRANTLAGLDKLVDAKLNKTPYTKADVEELQQNLGKAIEPSLLPFYKALSPKFHGLFIAPKQQQNG